MNSTNLFALSALLLTTVSTNWVRTGDFKRIQGTNWVSERQQVITNTFFLRPTVCPVCGGVGFVTNKITVERLEMPSTNSETRWIVLPAPAPPGAIPGQPSKE